MRRRGSGSRDEAFSAFVLARQGHLRAIAYSLCGDWHDADDLLQTALTKLYVAWPRVTRDGSPEAYIRRILVHVNIDDHRRRSRRVRTVPLESGPDRPGRASTPTEDRSALVAALQALPEQQRKVVVLRHWLGLSVRETAAELQLSEGTVKSHSSRGLAALEVVLAPHR
ncbi:RNA polymerase subunit sigma-24 [Nocardioides sp. Root122]|uniref:SigE family RNA polymerase sigma factor n=1 Tax=Nocardioides TaxID=1839 RepID=UPI0007035822|nr:MULTISPECIES: SigE family RNA polymerase sigma factor [Nocardioides]KQV77603.1 RNA polymerase subunit sigma-24 [Nocardioides sp. Root122]MCK9822043.1 SigE family RNA polymerase sigma factor [Nocardioides cavernae]